MSDGPDLDVLRDLLAVRQRVNALFEEALSRPSFEGLDQEGWQPPASVSRDDASWRLDLELAGIDQEAIDVRVEGHDLIVSGDRPMAPSSRFQRLEGHYGPFERRFPLPGEPRREAIDATFHHGVLRVTVPLSDGPGSDSIRVRTDDQR